MHRKGSECTEKDGSKSKPVTVNVIISYSMIKTLYCTKCAQMKLKVFTDVASSKVKRNFSASQLLKVYFCKALETQFTDITERKNKHFSSTLFYSSLVPLFLIGEYVIKI